ncbi:MAG: hypothetical protein ACRDYC_07040 [Acidimicrobiales bacterium]
MTSGSCVALFSAGGPVTLSAGTGAYTGISGTIDVTSKSTVILPKTSGGTCNTAAAASTWLAAVSYVTGSGNVSYGG